MSNIHNEISKENRLEEIIEERVQEIIEELKTSQDKCLRLSPLFKPLSDNELENRAIQMVETDNELENETIQRVETEQIND